MNAVVTSCFPTILMTRSSSTDSCTASLSSIKEVQSFSSSQPAQRSPETEEESSPRSVTATPSSSATPQLDSLLEVAANRLHSVFDCVRTADAQVNDDDGDSNNNNNNSNSKDEQEAELSKQRAAVQQFLWQASASKRWTIAEGGSKPAWMTNDAAA